MSHIPHEEIQKLIAECNQLREENARLQALLQENNLLPAENLNIPPIVESPSLPQKNKLSVNEKIALFRSLFQGRDDVYF